MSKNLMMKILREIKIWWHTQTNPILWTKTSEAFLEIIHSLCTKSENIIEIGCGTGHVSYMLAREGYQITLNEIRKDSLDRCKQIFKQKCHSTKYLHKDLFSITTTYHFLWNSGLIQCFPDKMKAKLVKKLAAISPKVLLFYPDTSDIKKQRGTNKKAIPGVDDAMEYNIDTIPSVMNTYFKTVRFGTLPASYIGLPFPMYWIYGDNS